MFETFSELVLFYILRLICTTYVNWTQNDEATFAHRPTLLSAFWVTGFCMEFRAALDKTNAYLWRKGIIWFVRIDKFLSDQICGSTLHRYFPHHVEFADFLINDLTSIKWYAVNAVWGYKRCLFWDPNKKHKYITWEESKILLTLSILVHTVTTRTDTSNKAHNFYKLWRFQTHGLFLITKFSGFQPFSHIGGYKHFERTRCLHLQDWSEKGQNSVRLYNGII